MREQEDRDKRVWEGAVSPGEKIQGTRVGRTEYRAHEADIKVRINKENRISRASVRANKKRLDSEEDAF